MTSSACTVCAHPQVANIDHLVGSGKSMRSVAKSFGLSEASVRRHTGNGHALPSNVASVASPPSRAIAAGASSYDIMRQTVDDLAAIDPKTLPPRLRVQHLDSLRRATETLARMEPPSAAMTIRIADVEGLPAFMADLFHLGDKFPMIRTEVAAMRRRHFPTTDEEAV